MELAQIDFGNLESNAAPRFSGRSIGYIISSALPYVFTFAGITLLIFLIYGGFSFMSAGGDPKSIERAKKIITNSFIGFLVVFFAYWIVQILGRILGVQWTAFQWGT